MSARPILVGYDDNPAGRAALLWAAREAELREAEVSVVYIVSTAWEWELAAVQINPDPILAALRRNLFGAWTSPLRDRGIRYRASIVHGRAGPALLACARTQHAACIVLGASSNGRLHGVLHSSGAAHLRHHARRPIIEVPAGAVHGTLPAAGHDA
jgi:nucleotide-binding universal stress UspA family protein